MATWHAIYEDAPNRTAEVEQGNFDAADRARFDAAAAAGTLTGRKVKGMWVVDGPTAQDDVIKVWGLVPYPIKVRHDAYLSGGRA